MPRNELAAAQPFASENNASLFLPSGKFPTPNHELAAAVPYRNSEPAPASHLLWPLDDNFSALADVTDTNWSEEAFAKACGEPKVVIPAATAQEASRRCGSRNFSEFMQTQGFPVGPESFLDGPFYSVDWTNTAALHGAIAQVGPVKLGISLPDPAAIPDAAKCSPSHGWAICNLMPNRGEFFCATLFGYGDSSTLVGMFKDHGLTMTPPAHMPVGLCYALFLRGTLGVLDRQSLLNITGEAWLRSPTTILKNRKG